MKLPDNEFHTEQFAVAPELALGLAKGCVKFCVGIGSDEHEVASNGAERPSQLACDVADRGLDEMLFFADGLARHIDPALTGASEIAWWHVGFGALKQVSRHIGDRSDWNHTTLFRAGEPSTILRAAYRDMLQLRIDAGGQFLGHRFGPKYPKRIASGDYHLVADSIAMPVDMRQEISTGEAALSGLRLKLFGLPKLTLPGTPVEANQK